MLLTKSTTNRYNIWFVTENKICMVHRCQNCPGVDGLLNKLMERFSDMDDEESIHFQQWQSID